MSTAGALVPDVCSFAGAVERYAAITRQFALARYNGDGSLDATFGTGGIVTTAISTSASATAVALQGDGEIVAAGSSSNGSTKFLHARALQRGWQPRRDLW